MKPIFKLFLYFLIFVFALFILGVTIKKFAPESIKSKFRETVLLIRMLKLKNKQYETKISELKTSVDELQVKVKYLLDGQLISSNVKNIKSKSNIYNIRTFQLPLLSRNQWMKPVAYLEQSKNAIIIGSGHGEFFLLDKKYIESEHLHLIKIKTNINDLIKNKNFYLNGPISIRDLLVVDNKIFFSFVKEHSKGCFNTSIMISELNLNYLNFSEFFSYKDCMSKKKVQKYPGKLLQLAHSGGRMVAFKNNKILLTIGDYGARPSAQDKNLLFGKIISIDLKTKKHELIAMGSRNAQGLYYDIDRDIIIHTEHGPAGGDEININFSPDNKNVKNFGWPISSYGERGYGEFSKDVPLHKSHKDYGFVEPIKVYSPSIAISEITKIPKIFNENFTNNFFISTLGWEGQLANGQQSIHHLRFNENFDQIIFEDVIPIDERIRDLIYIKEMNLVLLVLETIPAIGILRLTN